MLLCEPERAHGGHAPGRVEQLLLLGALHRALLRVERGRAAQVPAGRQRLHRHREQGGEQEAPVQDREPDERQPDHQRRPRELRHGLAHGLADLRDVAGHARGQVAGAGLLDPFQRQVQGVGDEPLPQLREHRLADARHELDAEHREQALPQRDGHQQQHRAGDGVGGLPVRHEIDDPAEQWCGQQAHRGTGDQRDGRGGGPAAVRDDELAQGPTHPRAGGHGQQCATHARASRHDSTACR